MYSTARIIGRVRYGQDFDRARLKSQLELFYAEVKEHLASAGDITKQDPHVEEDDTQECQKEACC